jgi:hypothetical protein
VDQLLFDEVADAVTSLVPPDLGEVRCRAHRYGIKVWFGAETPSKEHYEAQIMGAAAMDEAQFVVLEIGFHAEHPDEARNQALLDQLLRDERRWRRVLGSEAEAGAFLGRRDDWRRVSELWPDPDLSDPAIGLEIAARLTDYVAALEPARRRVPSKR